ncbi:MAG: right-handed parallel beta-helix repeat-containing protein, partial [Candidatus Hodarchaeales archaeon]
LELKNNVFTNNPIGIDIQSSYNLIIENNYFKNNYNCSLSTLDVNEINMINNTFLDTAIGVISERNNNLIIKSNIFSFNERGLIINQTSNVTIDNNSFERKSRSNFINDYSENDIAIFLEKVNLTYILNNIISGITIGILSNDSQTMILTGNRILNITMVLIIENKLNLRIESNYFYNFKSVTNITNPIFVEINITLNDFINYTSLFDDEMGPNVSIQVAYNYYDDYYGKDINFDGIGDTNHGIDPFPLYYPSKYYNEENEGVRLTSLYINPLDTKKRENILFKGLFPFITYYFLIFIGWGLLFGNFVIKSILKSKSKKLSKNTL